MTHRHVDGRAALVLTAFAVLVAVIVAASLFSSTLRHSHAEDPTPLPTVTADSGPTPTGSHLITTVVVPPTRVFDGTLLPPTMVTPDVTPLATRTP